MVIRSLIIQIAKNMHLFLYHYISYITCTSYPARPFSSRLNMYNTTSPLGFLSLLHASVGTPTAAINSLGQRISWAISAGPDGLIHRPSTRRSSSAINYSRPAFQYPPLHNGEVGASLSVALSPTDRCNENQSRSGAWSDFFGIFFVQIDVGHLKNAIVRIYTDFILQAVIQNQLLFYYLILEIASKY
jgi:hypothetical protein